MISYVLVPIASLILVGFQITFFDLLFMGAVRMELSLVLVIFAGFRLSAPKGGGLALLLGFCIDCMLSTIPYFFVGVYLLVFAVSKIVSFRMFAENAVFIMIFTFFASLFEGIVTAFVLGYSCSGDIGIEILWPCVLQALILAAVSPFLFNLFGKMEVFLGVRASQQT